MTTSKMFTLTLSDWEKAFIMAIIGGLFLPIAAMVQTPGFSVTNINWQSVLLLALNGAIVAGVGYLVKNFFSDSNGSFAGIMG